MSNALPMTDFDVDAIEERLNELKAQGATEIRVWHNYFQNFEWQLGIKEDGHMVSRIHHLTISDSHINGDEETFPITVTAQQLFDNAWDDEALSHELDEVHCLPEGYTDDGSPIWPDDYLEVTMNVSEHMLSKFNLDNSKDVKVFKQLNGVNRGLYHIRCTSLDELRKVMPPCPTSLEE